MRKPLIIVLVLAMAFVAIGCGSDSGGGLPTPDFNGTTTTAVINTTGKAGIVAHLSMNAVPTTYNAIDLAFTVTDYIGVDGKYTVIDETSGTLEGCGGSGDVAITNLVDFTDFNGSFTATFNNYIPYADSSGVNCIIDNGVKIASGSIDMVMHTGGMAMVDDCVDDGGSTFCFIGSMNGSVTVRNLNILGMIGDDVPEYAVSDDLTFDGKTTFSMAATRSGMTSNENLTVKFTDNNVIDDTINETMLDNLKFSGYYSRATGTDTDNITGSVYIPDLGKVTVSTPDGIIDDLGDVVLKGDIEVTVDMDFEAGSGAWSATIDEVLESGLITLLSTY